MDVATKSEFAIEQVANMPEGVGLGCPVSDRHRATDNNRYRLTHVGALDIPVNNLSWWRRAGTGPRYRRLCGNTVRYAAEDVCDWLDSHAETRTTGGVQ
jgi:hypothetical protein